MRAYAAVLAILLCGCATNPVLNSPYNKGVHAYQSKNYSQAASQWRIAVDSGDVNAKNNLAFLMFNGLGVERQQEQALELWKAAAMQGHSESQWHLGAAYEQGQSVDMDLAVAYAWYRCAIASTEIHLKMAAEPTEERIADDARESIIKLTDRLSQPELRRGQLLATEFIGKYAVEVP